MILHFKLLLRNCSRTLQSSPIQVRNFVSRSQILCINGCRSQFLRSFSTDVNLINQTHEGDSSSLLKQYLAIKKGYKGMTIIKTTPLFYERRLHHVLSSWRFLWILLPRCNQSVWNTEHRSHIKGEVQGHFYLFCGLILNRKWCAYVRNSLLQCRPLFEEGNQIRSQSCHLWATGSIVE